MNIISASVKPLGHLVYYVLLLLILSILCSTRAHAQGSQIEEVVVTAIKDSLKQSQDIKRNASSIVDVITNEGLGKFPDSNIAEALQRIPGISIDRNGGEGQFVTVRGFGPSFNTVLVNGRRIASETDSRAFSFDLYPAELIVGAEVFKSGVSHLQSGGIGSTINLKTAKPLDLGGFKAVSQVDGVWDINSDSVNPQFYGLISNTFAENTMGALLSVSYQERESEEEFLEQNGWLPSPVADFAGSIIANPANVATFFRPRETAAGVRKQNRERLNIQGVLEWEASSNLRLTLDGFYNDYDVESEATLLNTFIGLGAGSLSNIVLNENGTVLTEDIDSEIGTLIRSEGRPTETKMFGFKADWQPTEQLESVFDFAWSNAQSKPAGTGLTGTAVIGFLSCQIANDGSQFPEANQTGACPPPGSGFGQTFGFDMTSGIAVTTFNQALTSAINNFDQQRLHVAAFNNFAGQGTNGANTDEEIFELKLDNVYKPENGGFLKQIRFGANYVHDEKQVDIIQAQFATACLYCFFYQDAPNGLLTPFNEPLSSIPSTITRPAYDVDLVELIDHMTSAAALTRRDVLNGLAPGTSAALLAQLQQTEGGFQGTLQPSSFIVTEEIFAAYIDSTMEGEWGNFPWEVNLGFRWIYNRQKSTGNSSTIESLVHNIATLFETTLGADQIVTRKSSYHKLLPNLNLKVNLHENLALRFAASQTLARPELNDLSPRLSFGQLRPGNLPAAAGNPDLEPFTSSNLDFSLEYYFGDLNFVAVAGFWKSVENFIINTTSPETFNVSGGITVAPTLPGDPAIDEVANTVTVDVTRPANAETSTVKGVEIAAQYLFDFLPGKLNNIGVTGNATFVDSGAEFNPNNPVNVGFALPGLSNTLNGTLFYDDGRLDGRIAYSRRTSFLETLVNPKAAVEPIFFRSFEQLDFRVNYTLPFAGDRYQVFVEGINVLNEKIRKHGRFDEQFMVFRDTGARYSFGIRAEF